MPVVHVGSAQPRDEREHLFRPGVGGEIEVGAEPAEQRVADRSADEEQIVTLAHEPRRRGASVDGRDAHQLLDRTAGGLGGGVGDGHGRTAYEQATPMPPNWVYPNTAIWPRVCTRQFSWRSLPRRKARDARRPRRAPRPAGGEVPHEVVRLPRLVLSADEIPGSWALPASRCVAVRLLSRRRWSRLRLDLGARR